MLNWRQVAVLVLGMGSVLTLTIPAATQWLDAKAQAEAAAAFNDAAADAGERWQIDARAEADQFNADLFAGRTTDVDYASTLGLPSTDVMATLVIPKIELDQPIRHGMDERELVRGVGHAELSSLPVGGPSTHAVLGGHRGMAQSVGFTHLPELVIGDHFEIHVLGEIHAYEVIETETLKPMDAAVHPIEEGRDLVTLLTCTPLGVNSHRFVVTAERVPDELAEPAAQSDVPGFPWWVVWGVGGTGAVIGSTYWIGQITKRR